MSKSLVAPLSTRANPELSRSVSEGVPRVCDHPPPFAYQAPPNYQQFSTRGTFRLGILVLEDYSKFNLK